MLIGVEAIGLFLFCLGLSLGFYCLIKLSHSSSTKALPQSQSNHLLAGISQDDQTWLEVFRETVIASDGRISPFLNQLLDSKQLVDLSAKKTELLFETRLAAEKEKARIIGEAETQAKEIRERAEHPITIKLDSISELVKSSDIKTHAQKAIREPLDVGAIVVNFHEEFSPSSWNSISAKYLPNMSAYERCSRCISPQMVDVAAFLVFIYNNKKHGVHINSVALETPDDFILTQMFCGNFNMMPNHPLGYPASRLKLFPEKWKTINPGIDIHATLSVDGGIVFRSNTPQGYTPDDIAKIYVSASLILSGPCLR